MSDTKTLPQRLRQLAPHVAIVALGREGFEAMEAMREAADRIDAMTWDANSGNAALRYLDGWLDEMRAMKPNPEATIISVSAVRMMLYARITPKQADP